MIELACNNTLNVSNHSGGFSVLGRLEVLEKEPLDLEEVLNEGSGIMRQDDYLEVVDKNETKYRSRLIEDQVVGELSVTQLNIQGLCSSIDELKFLLYES